MARPLASMTDAEPSLTPIYHLDEIPRHERDDLQRMAGPQAQIRAVVDSDLLSDGQFGRCRLVVCERDVFVEERGLPTHRVGLDQMASACCRDFVGNGALEVRTKDGRRVEIIRYSKTMSESFQEISQRINETLQVSEAALEAQEEEVAKTSGPREQKATYRCPNCGHPLNHATDVCPKCTSKGKMMLRLVECLKGHWGLFGTGLLLSVFFTVADLGPGYLVKQLIDNTLKVEAVGFAVCQQRLFIIVGIFFALVLARAIAAHFRIKVMGTLGVRVVTSLRRRLYRTLQRLSLSYYDREHTGRIMSRVLNDTGAVQGFVVGGLQQMVVHTLKIVGICVVLFWVNWRLAAIALLPIPVVVYVSQIFAKKFRRIFRTVRRRFATLSATISERISGVRVVKSFAQEDREIDDFDDKLQECDTARLSAVRTQANFSPIVGVMMSAGVLCVWLIGGGNVLGGSLSLGTLLMFITYMQQFYNPVQQLLHLNEAFQDTATAAERIFSIMDMPSDVGDHEDARQLGEVTGRIDLKNVSFNYDDGERVLKNIDLAIEPGEMIGLVGETGSGKSTLVSLVCRFYDPEKGSVTLDGTDLRDIKTRSLRGNIGMVLQDPFLFAGTITENVAYGRPEATVEQVIQAAKAANAHDFVMNLPDGYDSRVGERGVGLSGGEKQRISIARAILKDPAILILDEATSSVDTATEASIQEAMDRLV
ncbi:ATP-binding cassette domain-containing protein, partial [bacterium]|nr:ATP-binding cassette domain-containing protein [bacterium]